MEGVVKRRTRFQKVRRSETPISDSSNPLRRTLMVFNLVHPWKGSLPRPIRPHPRFTVRCWSVDPPGSWCDSCVTKGRGGSDESLGSQRTFVYSDSETVRSGSTFPVDGDVDE